MSSAFLACQFSPPERDKEALRVGKTMTMTWGSVLASVNVSVRVFLRWCQIKTRINATKSYIDDDSSSGADNRIYIYILDMLNKLNRIECCKYYRININRLYMMDFFESSIYDI